MLVIITNRGKYKELLQSSTIDKRVCSPLKLWQTLVYRFSGNTQSTDYTRSRANSACAKQYGFIVI